MRGPYRKPDKLGKRLLQAILDSGKTYYEIELETGVQHTNIYSYIKDAKVPSSGTLYALCICLGVSADWLLGLKEEQ